MRSRFVFFQRLRIAPHLEAHEIVFVGWRLVEIVSEIARLRARRRGS